jgi:hypothetical protein
MSYDIFLVTLSGILFLFWFVNRLHKPSPSEQ